MKYSDSVDILIKNGIVLLADFSFKNINVGIKGRAISYIGNEEPQAQTIIDASNMMVLPGFINSHTHAGMHLFRGIADDLKLKEWLEEHIWPLEAKWVSRDFVKASTELAVLEMIKSGITTFSDMYFFEDEVAKVVENTGIRAILGEGIIDFPTPSFANALDTLSFVKELAYEYRENERINISVAPHSIYTCSLDTLKKAKEVSNEYNLRLHIHVSETLDEVLDAKRDKKKTPVEYLDSLGLINSRFVAVHFVHAEKNDINIMKQREGRIILNIQSNKKLGSGIPHVKEYMNAGLTIGIGTDSVVSNNDLDMFGEMQDIAMSDLDPQAIRAKDVLSFATIKGAEAWGMDGFIGSIEVGKRADIILVDFMKPHLQPLYNPISSVVYAAHPEDVDSVIVDGRILMKHREMLTMDEEEILHNARAYAERIK